MAEKLATEIRCLVAEERGGESERGRKKPASPFIPSKICGAWVKGNSPANVSFHNVWQMFPVLNSVSQLANTTPLPKDFLS